MFTRKITLVAILSSVLASCSSDDTAPVPDRGRPDLFVTSDLFPNTDLFPPTCTTTNCTGCCEGNSCKDGITKELCGSNGAACSQCGASSECVAGECKTVECGASSCTGCCGPGCLNGTTSDSCGSGGTACVKCGTGESCVDGKCTSVSTEKLYKVVLVSASVATAGVMACMSSGRIFDTACDLYVKLKVGTKTAQSKMIENNNGPTWNEELLTVSNTELSKGFTLELYDQDPIGSTGMCKAEHKTTTEAELTAGALSLDCKDLLTLTNATLKIEFKPVTP